MIQYLFKNYIYIYYHDNQYFKFYFTTNFFEQLEDNRRSLSKLHNLNNILVMAIIAVICGVDSWNDIEEYCLAKEEWISKFLKLKNGFPSHDPFNRIISRID